MATQPLPPAVDDDPALDGAEVVELRFPARPDCLVLARLVTSAVAGAAGFDVEELDDLRLAVDELCLAAGDMASGGQLHLRIATVDDEMLVSCTHERGGGAGGVDGASHAVPGTAAAALTADLSERILSALVDSHWRSEEGGRTTASMRKRRRGRATA